MKVVIAAVNSAYSIASRANESAAVRAIASASTTSRPRSASREGLQLPVPRRFPRHAWRSARPSRPVRLAGRRGRSAAPSIRAAQVDDVVYRRPPIPSAVPQRSACRRLFELSGRFAAIARRGAAALPRRCRPAPWFDRRIQATAEISACASRPGATEEQRLGRLARARLRGPAPRAVPARSSGPRSTGPRRDRHRHPRNRGEHAIVSAANRRAPRSTPRAPPPADRRGAEKLPHEPGAGRGIERDEPGEQRARSRSPRLAASRAPGRTASRAPTGVRHDQPAA